MTLSTAIRIVEQSVTDELHRIAPLANTMLDNPACINARKRRKSLDAAWTMLKNELKAKESR